jgi:hypothetical protein
MRYGVSTPSRGSRRVSEIFSVFRTGPQSEHEDIAIWLRSLGISCPPGRSRYPTTSELRSVLDGIEGACVEYDVSATTWSATVQEIDNSRGAWTVLRVPDYSGNDAVPYDFYFSGGWSEFVLLIVERVARLCGPLVVVMGSGADPIVVTPSADSASTPHS